MTATLKEFINETQPFIQKESKNLEGDDVSSLKKRLKKSTSTLIKKIEEVEKYNDIKKRLEALGLTENQLQFKLKIFGIYYDKICSLKEHRQ